MRWVFGIVVIILSRDAESADAGRRATADSAGQAPLAAGNRPPDPQTNVDAVRLYDEGLLYFRIGEYDRAIESLKAAYLKAPMPALLYNLGQAFRLKGNCAEALAFYQRFLATGPVSRDRTLAEARIADVQRCAASARDETTRASAVPRPPPALAAANPATPVALISTKPSTPATGTQRMSGRRRAGVVTAVAAAVLASSSGYFAWCASQASDDVSGVFVPRGTWTDAASDADRAGVRNDRLALASGAAAAVTAAVAGWLLWK